MLIVKLAQVLQMYGWKNWIYETEKIKNEMCYSTLEFMVDKINAGVVGLCLTSSMVAFFSVFVFIFCRFAFAWPHLSKCLHAHEIIHSYILYDSFENSHNLLCQTFLTSSDDAVKIINNIDYK